MLFGSTSQAITPRRSKTRPRRYRFLIALLLLPFLSSGLGARVAQVAGDELADAQAKQAALQEQIKKQKEQVEALNAAQGKLRGAINETTAALEGINADLDKVRASIASMIIDIDRVKAEYRALVAELATLDGDLVKLEAQEIRKRGELVERKALLAGRLRAAYDTDRVTLLETFLSGGSFSDMLSEVSYHLDVGAQDRALAEQIKEDQETLASLHASVEATRTATNRLRQDTAVHKIELDRQLVALEEAQAHLKVLEAETERVLSEQRNVYAALAENKKELQASIKRAAVAKARVSNEIEELIERQRRIGNIPSQYNGTLVWPMSGAISGEYGCSSYPGYAPGNGCEHYHNGIDIVAPCGTEVKAGGPGRVAYIGWNYADGFDPAWIVVIAHSANLQTWYAHMEPAYPGGITAGSAVTTGQLIGYEGTTGNSTGCHLHWMVDLDGAFHNPRLFL